MKNNKYFFIFSLIFILLISISAISAFDVDTINTTDNNAILSTNEDSINTVDNSLNSESYQFKKTSYNLVLSSNDKNSVNAVSGENNESFINLNSYSSLKNSNLHENSEDFEDGDSSNGSDLDDDFDSDEDNDSNDYLDNITELVNNSYIINVDNFYDFFDEDNILKSDYAGSYLVFEGEFIDMGIITISGDSTSITANHNLFKNTVFCIDASNVILTNLNFDLDKEFSLNDNAGILILEDNATIYNITMNYTVPRNTTGFCIYSEGSSSDKINGLNILNSTFNYEGQALNKGWDYGLFISYTDDAYISNCEIESKLPLRNVDYSFDIFGGISMDAVSTLALDHSDNLTLSSNYIHTEVNGKCDGYPTLETVLVYGCKDMLIEDNIILAKDFVSSNGENNYLGGIHFFFTDDTTVVGNEIHIETTGGRKSGGSAYPIYVSGPADNMKIAFNNLTTINNGPNIGIYSENYYGNTHIDIISNFINVTGLAGSDSWALVAGIEVQDDNDTIMNNTIIVTNIANYANSNNVYGISYSQNINGNHTYNIQYNNVTTNGNYAVKLAGSNSNVTDSIVANNVLNANSLSANKAVIIGTGINNSIYNNTSGRFKNKMTTEDYPKWLNITIANKSGRSFNFNWITNAINSASNGTGASNNTGNSSGISDNGGNDTYGNGSSGNSSIINGTGDSNGTGNSTGNITNPTNSTGDGTNNGSDTNSSGGSNTNPIDVPISPDSNNTNSNINNTNINNSDINNTDLEHTNSTEPINNTVKENTTESVNDTNQTYPSQDENIDPNDEPVEEPKNSDDETNIDNDKDKNDNEDEHNNPGESNEDLDSNSDDSSDSTNSNPSSQEDSQALASASSPGLSGASAANDAYELDEIDKDIVTKSVDYLSLAGVIVVVLILLIIGYKRQRDIEEEE